MTGRLVWDNVIRGAIAVIALDWLAVGWRTFIWLDVAALVAMIFAVEAGNREGRRSSRPSDGG